MNVERTNNMDEIFEVKYHDVTHYVAQITSKEDHLANFVVREISRWDLDDSYDINDGEVVIDGCIKWDGCSHINFGDKSGYMHLCGKSHWNKFTEMLPKVYEWVTSKISSYDKNVADA